MWSDKQIRYGVEELKMVWVPWEREQEHGGIADFQFQPASIDVRLGNDFIRHPDGARISQHGTWATYTLSPGECVLASLVERVRIPSSVVARIEGKSTWARRFLTVHSAGFIDPGFFGDITLELKNDSMERIDIVPGVPIAQLSFQSLDSPAERPYGSHGLNSRYMNQIGTNPAK